VSRATLAALVLGVLTVAAPSAVRAEQAPEARASETSSAVLGVDEVVRAALARSPQIAAAEQERAIASADVLSAEGGFDPSWKTRASIVPVSPYEHRRLETVIEQPTAIWGTRTFAGYRIGRGDFAVYDGKLATAEYGEVRGGLTVPLLRDGPIDRRRAGIQRAELGTELAKLTVEQQRIEIARLAAFRYWEWAAAGRRVSIAHSLLEMAVARDAGLALRVERGDLPALERMENLRAIAQRQAQLAAAERSLQSATIELSLYFRQPDGTPIMPPRERLPRELPEARPTAPRNAEDERRAVGQRPDVRRLEVAAEQSKVDIVLARNQQKVAIDVFGAVSRDLGPGDPKRFGTELEVGVMLDVPILNRVQEGREQAAQAVLARTTAQARLARDRVRADVRDAASAMDMARERALAARSEVDVAARLVDGERRRFEQGEGTLLIVNLREQALAEAELREVEALGDFQRAAASYRAAVGEPR